MSVYELERTLKVRDLYGMDAGLRLPKATGGTTRLKRHSDRERHLFKVLSRTSTSSLPVPSTTNPIVEQWLDLTTQAESAIFLLVHPKLAQLV